MSGGSASELSDSCEVDGGCTSRPFLTPTASRKGQRKKKKKKKRKKPIDISDDEALSVRSPWEVMRKRTISLMKKTAVYATQTGNLLE